MTLRFRLGAALVTASVVLAGCHSDQSLEPPPVPTAGPLFQRYVAMGNSITAGFQSAGINDSTQKRSYARLFAIQAGADFVYPSLQGRGCPPPLVNNVTQVRVGGNTTSQTCDLRASTMVPYLQNVAVPGARVREVVDNLGVPPDSPPLVPLSASNALTTFFLGGRTQLSAMMQLPPTFVSVWIGNNDVLGAFTDGSDPGNPALVTPQSTFEEYYAQIVDGIASTAAPAVLISVTDVTNTPFASLGAIYWCAKNGGCPAPLPPALPIVQLNPLVTVSNTCAPAGGGVGLTTLVPWTIGIAGVLRATPSPTNPLPVAFNLDCTNTNQVVTPAELGNLRAAVAGYNGYIKGQAEARGWAYLDVNPPLLALRAQGLIPAFPDLSQVLANPANPGPITFGPYFSLDGIHPSSQAHVLVADSLISVVNRTYSTTIPLLP